jgi:hypothetical protein
MTGFMMSSGVIARVAPSPWLTPSWRSITEREGTVRHIVTSLLVAAWLSSSAVASQTRSGSGGADKVCALLSRDLVMKVSTPAGRKALEGEKPIEDYLEQVYREAGRSTRYVSSCSYGAIILALDPLGRPDQIRDAMRARRSPYEKYEPIPGVGDAAFFVANRHSANLSVWAGSRHFQIDMIAGVGEDATELKPNITALARAIVPQLR